MRIHGKIEEILRLRGMDDGDMERFLNPSVEQIRDPGGLRDIDRAVDLIIHHMERGSTIMIHGDYDADGITALSLLYRVLSRLYESGRLIPYIPDRFVEGYGLSMRAVKKAIEEGVSLIITADCGITSVEEVDEARRHGIDVIITDHHEPPAELPRASAIIHPMLSGDYQFKHLTGVGVAFKLMQALYDRLGKPFRHLLWDLDLVAIGTVADMGELVDENRAMVSLGLKVLRETKKAGLKALKFVVGVDGYVSTWHVAFLIAPRLNSAGRISDPIHSFNLLTERDGDRALLLSHKLNRLNQERQKYEKRVLDRAMEQALRKRDRDVLVLWDWGWHEGIIGIVASRIVNRWNRPAIIISVQGETSRGSARSTEGFHMQKALSELSYMFENFGGHEMAAGFTIRTEYLEEFEEKINRIAKEHLSGHTPSSPRPEAVLLPEDLDDIFVRDLRRMAPFGNGNPSPVFLMNSLKVVRKEVRGRTLYITFSTGRDELQGRIYEPSERWLNLEEGEVVDLLMRFREVVRLNGQFLLEPLDFSR